MKTCSLLARTGCIAIFMILSSYLPGQESHERQHTDMVIQRYCAVCLKEKNMSDKLEELFHEAHTLGRKTDNERLILIMNTIDLARSSHNKRMLFFCTY